MKPYYSYGNYEVVLCKDGSGVIFENITEINIDDNNLAHIIDGYGTEVAVYNMNNICGIKAVD